MKKMHQHSDDAVTRALCESPRPDDGVSPNVQARQRERQGRRKPSHHQEQLCKQATRAIDASILCDCGDPIFECLGPCRVTPKGRGNELLVTFEVEAIDPETIEHVQARLEAVKGLLRSAVAEAIHRKRVPGLRIQVVPIT
jgi:hypothetical protein